MTQLIENTSFRTLTFNMVDNQLTTIPWPTGFIAGAVIVNANSSTVGGIVHARSGGSPFTVALSTPLSNLTVTSTDISLSPPAGGTNKITVGRTSVGLQLHSGGSFSVTVTFLG